MGGLHIAAAIIRFIDYAGRLIAPNHPRQNPSNEVIIEHRELGSIAQALLSNSRGIDDSLRSQHRQHTNTDIVISQHHIATDCQGIAGEILDAIEFLQEAGPTARWRSFRYALRDAWDDSQVRGLDRRLSSLRQQSIVNTLDNLRLEAVRLNRAQAFVRRAPEELQEYQQSGMAVGNRFVHEWRLGDGLRKLLIQSILENQRHPSAMLPPFLGLKPRCAWARGYENGVRDRVLHKLTFQNMEYREQQIPKPYDEAFNWIFRDPVINDTPWSSFRDFLRGPTSKIYWIAGKPGSGKSALMKYIRQSSETRNLLKQWSGGGNVLQAAFYFCNIGGTMQMSIEGLLQTLLLECLRPLPSSIIQRVLPARWEVACLFDQDDSHWSWEELSDALRTLLRDIYAHQRFFILIDGLDECSGEQSQLIDLILELAEDTDNLKLCVASRPWPHFEDAFMSRPRLLLEHLNQAGIDDYIESKFEESTVFRSLRQREPESSERLINEISNKAEGSFLWAQLTIQHLLDALSNGDKMYDLEMQLRDLLPGDLERLLQKMLEALDDEEREHASRIFQVFRACDDSPTILCVALADVENTRLAKDKPVKIMPIQYKESLSRGMRRTLLSRCQGLLEVSAPSLYEDYRDASDQESTVESDEESREESDGGTEEETDNEDESNASSSRVGPTMRPISHMEVKYLHRAVRDYIETPHVWEWIVSMSSVRFDPNLTLCKANILRFKGLDPLSLSATEFWFHIQMAIKYAVRCMKVQGNVREVVELLDQVDTTGAALTYHYTNPIFVDRPGSLGEDDHWTSFFLPTISQPEFAHLMAVCGVHQYLTMRLNKSDVRNDGLTGNQTPLLIASLQEIASISDCEELVGPHVHVVEVLMRKGADCYQNFQGRSALSLARRARKFGKHKQVYEEVLRVFERLARRSLPPSRPDSSMALTKRDSQLRKIYQGSDSESMSSTDGLCEGQNGRERTEEKRSSKKYSTIHIQGRKITMRGGNNTSEPDSQYQDSSSGPSWPHYSHSLNSRAGETSRVGQISAFQSPRSLPAWDQQQASSSRVLVQRRQSYPLRNHPSDDSTRASQVATPRRPTLNPSRFYSNPFLTPQGNIY